MKEVGKVHQVDWHRNGVSGDGFHAVLFEMKREPGHPLALAILFAEPGQCAVVQVASLSDPNVGVQFGMNSWRGDHFEPELRGAIRLADHARDAEAQP